MDRKRLDTELKKLSKLTKKKFEGEINCFVIVCGGDGSIVWGIDELESRGCDFRNLALAVLPLGTGNDFSAAMKFGSK